MPVIQPTSDSKNGQENTGQTAKTMKHNTPEHAAITGTGADDTTSQSKYTKL